MRLHRLEVTAFGPFADRVEVDFEELNDAGLFLLTGATGAGKSSLLDAVCFALYGTVPGVRGVKTLKSHHAGAEVKPEVVLDFGVQGRRFVVRRTPEWARPKRRGEGVLTEKSSASITETTGGTERFLSSRAAEVGLLVAELMGMSAAQFAQVALLPQGEFQTFLRASSQDRHDVLQHLFRTARFSRIEDWVHDRSRHLKERSESGRATVLRILGTSADRAGTPLPEELTGDALAAAAADGRVVGWVRERLGEATACLCQASQSAEQWQAALAAQRGRLDEAVRRTEHRARRESALRTLAELEETAPQAAAAVEALDGHQRAERCRPLLELLQQAREEQARLSADRDVALGRLRTVVPEATADVLTPRGERLRGDVARLEALRPRQDTAERVRRVLSTDRERLESAEGALHAAVGRATLLPQEIDALVARLDELAACSARGDALQAAVRLAEARCRAATELEPARERLAAAEDARRDARDRAQDARELLHDLVARRLAGMAAELAGQLADGRPCQVCGSTEHPAPAAPAEDAVTVEQQEAADQAYSRSRTALDEAERLEQEHRSRCDRLATAADGVAPDDAAREVDALRSDLLGARSAGAELVEVEAQVRALRAEQETLSRSREETAATVAELRRAVRSHEETLEEVANELRVALGLGDDTDPREDPARLLDARLDELRRAEALVDQARAAVEAAESVTGRVDVLQAQVDTTLAEQGLGSDAEARRSLLADDRRSALEERLRSRDAAVARARAVLDELPEDSTGESGESPDERETVTEDVAALAAAVAGLETECAEATRVRTLCEDRVTALGQQLDRLETAMRDWAPLRDESLRAESMSKLVRGMGHDNQLQMRLSAYVLATRLDQVVAAANERLGHMRDQRYLLQRTGRAERRGAQAGLGLEIVDQWTGDVRPPTTLSGGETFVVSLSLALGLADVVTQEAGGTEVETLFVDEGFGTLDADTLDDVMDRLDGLRAGGRTVGVVSHVSELRSRIPTQVRVEKGRAGSTVTVGTLVG